MSSNSAADAACVFGTVMADNECTDLPRFIEYAVGKKSIPELAEQAHHWHADGQMEADAWFDCLHHYFTDRTEEDSDQQRNARQQRYEQFKKSLLVIDPAALDQFNSVA